MENNLETTVEVKINGVPYDTIIDNQGVQRFQKNNLYGYLINSGMVDLNELSCAYQNGSFTREEYMEFYRGIGYSVSGFCDIFDDVEIENPLWE